MQRSSATHPSWSRSKFRSAPSVGRGALRRVHRRRCPSLTPGGRSAPHSAWAFLCPAPPPGLRQAGGTGKPHDGLVTNCAQESKWDFALGIGSRARCRRDMAMAGTSFSSVRESGRSICATTRRGKTSLRCARSSLLDKCRPTFPMNCIGWKDTFFRTSGLSEKNLLEERQGALRKDLAKLGVEKLE